MIPKRHVILIVILVVAFNLAFSVAYAASCTHVETWNFQLTNETLSWNHVDETTIITAYRGWLPILAPVLILFFALTMLTVVVTYAIRRKPKK